MGILSRTIKLFWVGLAGLVVANLFVSIAFLGQQKKVTISNEIAIQAKVLSLSNGTYTLHSNIFGTFTLLQSKIQSIRSNTERRAPYNQSTTRFNLASRHNRNNQQSGFAGSGFSEINAGDPNSQQLQQQMMPYL